MNTLWIFLATQSGYPIEALFLVFVLISAIRRKRLSGERAAIVFLAFSLFRLLGEVLKSGLAFPRPCWEKIPAALVACPNTFSFPSGHAIGILMVTVIAGLMSRRRRILIAATVSGIVVAWSRVVVGIHTPLDVLAGAALGGLFGLAVWRLFAR